MSEQTVFIVDDDPAVCRSVSALLSAHGFANRCFASAEQFLDGFDLGQPGCLITDFRMGGMSGAELQRRLLELGSALPIIVVTGHADVPVAVEFMERGALTLLEKPYDPNQLRRAVERALQRDEQFRQKTARRAEVVQHLATLTVDERQVLRSVLAGKPNKSIAQQLGVSMRTIDRRRRSILKKMHVSSLPELASRLAGESVGN
jgi:RNA polymerase sigma factor (sigma-70 family)